MIRHLRHHQIDTQQWDSCITRSSNRLVYASSWFLDVVSPGWEALVDGNYQTIMPLPSKQKYGLHYLIQPRFTQQLGIFSPHLITAETVQSFLKHIPKKFVWCNINLNEVNCTKTITKFTLRTNYELNLQTGYTNIVKGYNENTRRNIKKSITASIVVSFSEDAELFVGQCQMHSKVKPEGIALEQFSQLIRKSINIGTGKIILAKNTHNETIAGAFYLTDWDRIIYLASFTTGQGQTTSAMFLIMDRMIKKYASQFRVFDFEGSMIPGIAQFFKGFGATKKEYPQFAYKAVNPLWLF